MDGAAPSVDELEEVASFRQFHDNIKGVFGF